MSRSEPMIVNELNFWLDIMREHAIFLRLALPPGETQLIQTAVSFERRYTALLERVNPCPDNQIKTLGQEALNLTLEFIQFMTVILDRALECRLLLQNAFPLLVDHVRREAIHFVFNLVRYLNNEPPIPIEDLLNDEVFWLRIMADHSKFINHLLDPSERRMVMTTQSFSDTFDLLRCQAEDFQSMLSITPRPIPSLIRFAQETLQAARDIRQFKAVATREVAQCRVLTLAPPLLLDHLRREAERFIFEIERDLVAIPPLPEKDMPQPCPVDEVAGPVLEPSYEEIVIESPLQEELVTTPVPLSYPQTGFVQSQRTRIKIKFVK